MTMANAGDRPPRYGEKTSSFHVGRGPVPRHAEVYRKIAGETRSDARMETSEGPRATVIVAAVRRGPVPRRGYRVRRDRGGQAPALR